MSPPAQAVAAEAHPGDEVGQERGAAGGARVRELPLAAARLRSLTFTDSGQGRSKGRGEAEGRQGRGPAVEDSGALGVLLGDLAQASRPELRRRTGVWALSVCPHLPILAHINIAISRHVASQLSEVGPGRPTAADALAKGGWGAGRRSAACSLRLRLVELERLVGAPPRSALSRHVTARTFPASGLGHEAQQGTGNVCGNTVTKLL